MTILKDIDPNRPKLYRDLRRDGDDGHQCEMVGGRRTQPTASFCQNKAEFLDYSLVVANILSACWI